MLCPQLSFSKAAPLICGLVAILSSLPATAGTPAPSRLSAVINDVQVAGAPGKAYQPTRAGVSMDGAAGLRTGALSRAELQLRDGGIVRLGPDTVFEARSSWRNTALGQGTLLAQTPWSWKSTKLQAGGVTVVWQRATALIEHMPGHHVKVLSLEGDVRVFINARFGESTIVTPGKMLIVAANEMQMPKAVAVDLARIVKTSTLIDPARFQGDSKVTVAPLPSLGLIEKQIARQSAGKRKARIAETNLLIAGGGTNVIIAPKEVMAALDGKTEPQPTAAADPLVPQTPELRMAAVDASPEPALPAADGDPAATAEPPATPASAADPWVQ